MKLLNKYLLRLLFIFIISFQYPVHAQITTEDLFCISDYCVFSATYMSANYTSQNPADPNIFDSPTTSTIGCVIPLNPRKIMWIEPDAGVNSDTGLLVVLTGITSNSDCNPSIFVPDDSWRNSRNIIITHIFYRNIAYIYPYDFGKYQIVDVLRGVGKILELYPQINIKRFYIYGGSGGGHLALQVIQASRHLWSECYIHSAITKITLPKDKYGNYESDPNDGWNIDLGFPTTQGGLSDSKWNRYQAERELRSPQFSALKDAVFSSIQSEYIPTIWMMHGTSDETVDYQHFLDYKNCVESFAEYSSFKLENNHYQLGNWHFINIINGDHQYTGAAADENTRAKATNKYNPLAFTKEKNDSPSLSINYVFPSCHGWRFRIFGKDLGSVDLFTEETPSEISNWENY